MKVMIKGCLDIYYLTKYQHIASIKSKGLHNNQIEYFVLALYIRTRLIQQIYHDIQILLDRDIHSSLHMLLMVSTF